MEVLLYKDDGTKVISYHWTLLERRWDRLGAEIAMIFQSP